MKKIIMALILAVSIVPLAPANDPSPDSLTLKECYALALLRSESVAIQEEAINETAGVMLQALSTALPKVAFAYSEKWQDIYKRNSIRDNETEAKFTFSQPLFTGFKEFAAIRASKHVGRQREAELLRAKHLLMTDVADAFYLYLSFQEDEEAVDEIRKTLFERVGELKKRQVLGKSRPSEIASAEAALRRNEAVLENVRAQKEVSGQLLEYLVGRPFARLVYEEVSEMTMSLSDALACVDKRPDIISASEALESFKQNVVSARSTFFPSVNLSGNFYTKRPDVNENNDWDTTLSVSVPLFNGLNDWGLVKEARAQKNQADLRLSQARRIALLEIQNAFTLYQADGRRVKALERAVESADRNYQLQAEDFSRSLVNNLDVLQALQDSLSVKRDLVSARSDSRRAYWVLKVAMGDINP